MKDLEPKGGSLAAKFKLNAFQGPPDDGDGVAGQTDHVGLRTARLNHSCQPNSCNGYDEVTLVRILLAQKDVHPGEEICIIYSNLGASVEKNYTLKGSQEEIRPFLSFVRMKYGLTDANRLEDLEFYLIQWDLELNWGMTCPADCFCKTLPVKELIVEGKRYFKEMLISGSKGRIEDALNAGDRVLEIEKELNFSWNHRAIINWDLYEMAIASTKMDYARATKYLQTCW